MKTLVIYDSFFGNTEQIARAIADGLTLAAADAPEVDVRKIGDARPDQLAGLNVLVVGSPTQRFSSTTAMRDFLKAIPKKALVGVSVAGFDRELARRKPQGFSPGGKAGFSPALARVPDLHGCRNSCILKHMKYQRDEHRVHLIVYHLIWCPKRRKPVLVGEVAKDLRSLIEAKCEEKGWEILELAIQPDHVHLFLRAWPSDAAADIVQECKGATSRELRKKHKHLQRLPSLWTRSYFASTAGNVSSETIQKYIAAQSKL